jgi:chromosome segregation ATPase
VERLTAELARETIAAQDMSEQMATARTDRDRYRACWKDALAGLKTVGAERDALRSKLAKAEERAIAQATAIAELLPPQPPGDLVDAVAGELQRLRTKLEAAERSIGAATIDLHAAREQAAQALALARQQGDDATRAEQRVAELEQQLAHLTNPPVVTTT